MAGDFSVLGCSGAGGSLEQQGRAWQPGPVAPPSQQLGSQGTPAAAPASCTSLGTGIEYQPSSGTCYPIAQATGRLQDTERTCITVARMRVFLAVFLAVSSLDGLDVLLHTLFLQRGAFSADSGRFGPGG